MRERVRDRVRALVKNERAGIPTGMVCLTASLEPPHSPNTLKLWRKRFAGRGADVITLEIGRSVAGAKFELAQIRRIKVALIARMSEFGEFEVSNPLGTSRQIKRILNLIDRGLPFSLTVPAQPSMPSSEPERSTDAMRRALPELVKLDRYERRATAKRDRASRQIIARKVLLDNL
jgi:hypothetical protein